MDRYSYPHTIENGAGERLTFERKVAGSNGDRLEGDTVVAVQRVVFPILMAIGTMLGKFGKFGDAPAPVRRRVQ